MGSVHKAHALLNGARTLVPLLLLIGGVLGLAGTILAGTAPDDGTTKREPLPDLCQGWHRGAGATETVDLAEIRKSYLGLKTKLDRGIARASENFEEFLERPHRTGLPACRGTSRREERLKDAAPPGLAGRVLYFASLDDAATFRAPREAIEAEGCVTLLLDARRVGEIGKLSERIRKPVYLASAELARALGVRCSGTLVRISEKGETIELHEGL